MRVLSTILSVAVVLSLSALGAIAYPTFGGATGLVTLPTADTAPQGSGNLALDYQRVHGDRLWIGRINGGIGRNLEAWGGYTSVSNGNDSLSIDRLWNVGAKFAFWQDAARGLGAAIGGSFGQADNSEDVNLATAFLVASANLGQIMADENAIRVRGHAGVMWLHADDPIDENATRPYIGADFTERHGGTLALEYRWKEDAFDNKGVFSAAVRYPFGSRENPLWVQVGTTNGGIGGLGSRDQRLFVGASIGFGG